jgi:hypothetical protein
VSGTLLALRTDLGLEDCQRRLQEATDAAKRTVFSFSGYKGSRPVLSNLDGSKFKIWKRRYYRNSFAPFFFGTLSQENGGTRVEGRFDMDPFVKGFMIFWLAIVGFSGIAEVFSALSHGHSSDARTQVLLIGGMFLFGLILPRFGQFIGKSEERFLRDFLESTLAARTVDLELEPSNRTISNKPLG